MVIEGLNQCSLNCLKCILNLNFRDFKNVYNFLLKSFKIMNKLQTKRLLEYTIKKRVSYSLGQHLKVAFTYIM